MDKISIPRDLLIKDLFSAEKQIPHALPEMAQAATNENLREAFEAYLKEAETRVND